MKKYIFAGGVWGLCFCLLFGMGVNSRSGEVGPAVIIWLIASFVIPFFLRKYDNEKRLRTSAIIAYTLSLGLGFIVSIIYIYYQIGNGIGAAL